MYIYVYMCRLYCIKDNVRVPQNVANTICDPNLARRMPQFRCLQAVVTISIYITLHYNTFHCIALHCITLHYNTFHCIALHTISIVTTR